MKRWVRFFALSLFPLITGAGYAPEVGDRVLPHSPTPELYPSIPLPAPTPLSVERVVALAHEAAQDEAIERQLLPTPSSIAEEPYMTDQHVRNALVAGWLEAVEEFLADHLLTEEEEQKLVTFQEQYSLSDAIHTIVPGADRIQKARALREILDGQLPARPQVSGADVFNFQKSENLLWVFDDVRYLEGKNRRHYEGGHTGASFRVAKGIYWRIGAFKGYPVDRTETVDRGSGTLAVTTKHLYFYSPRKAFRVRHDKIVSITPFSDGIAIQRDAATAKPQKFICSDGWFLHNLVQNAPEVA